MLFGCFLTLPTLRVADSAPSGNSGGSGGDRGVDGGGGGGSEARPSRRAHAALDGGPPGNERGSPADSVQGADAAADARRRRSSMPPEAGQMEPMLTLLHEPDRQAGAARPPTDAWGGAYPPAGPEGGPHPAAVSSPKTRRPPAHSALVTTVVDPHSIEACENLLENYFMQARSQLRCGETPPYPSSSHVLGQSHRVSCHAEAWPLGGGKADQGLRGCTGRRHAGSLLERNLDLLVLRQGSSGSRRIAVVCFAVHHVLGALPRVGAPWQNCHQLGTSSRAFSRRGMLTQSEVCYIGKEKTAWKAGAVKEARARAWTGGDGKAQEAEKGVCLIPVSDLLFG